VIPASDVPQGVDFRPYFPLDTAFLTLKKQFVLSPRKSELLCFQQVLSFVPSK
jgi:hypothetical protein